MSADKRLGPFEGYSVQRFEAVDDGEGEIVLTLHGEGEADDLVLSLSVTEAAATGASIVEVATGRRPEWVERVEPYE